MSPNSISRRSLDDHFDPTCPNNAKWYACPKGSKSNFVGCCNLDPCGLSTGCTITNLQPVSFNASFYGSESFPPDPDCGASDILPYSCVSKDQKNTFWGCCKSNPCQNTPPKCKDGDLMQAVLKTDMQLDAFTGSGKGSSSSSSDKHVNTGIIAGATVGGVVVVVAIISVLIFCLCKKRRSKNKGSDRTRSPPAETSNMGGFQDTKDYRGSTMSEAPPTYSSPNPNHGEFAVPQHKGHNGYRYQQVAQAPMELSGESSLSAAQAAPKNFVAELPDTNSVGGTSPRSPALNNAKAPIELESPVIPQSHPASPHRKPQPRFQEVIDNRT